jgi:glycosyltransferase involved in cell wall biosynthesis
MSRVLHVLSQRPSLTGSGITLDALVRHGNASGWDQRAAVGVPGDDPHPRVGDLDASRIHPLVFGRGELDFPVPGMSDVMPYPSTRFSAMTESQLASYRSQWSGHLLELIEQHRPQLIHSHHLWIVTSLLKNLAPEIPTVAHCHATGLRQMELCPRLAPAVRRGLEKIDRFVVLHRGDAERVAAELQLSCDRVQVIGAGYREDLFHARGRPRDLPPRLLYIGKYSAAKGLPSLLDAFQGLQDHSPEVELHIAGTGSGAEAELLRQRMSSLAPSVVLHGQLSQEELASLMRRCTVCVLPSFYEGLPLVLVEALACGCRLVSTALPGVIEQLAPHLGDALVTVPLPHMKDIDTPDPAGLPSFATRLQAALVHSLMQPPIGDPSTALPGALEPMTWGAVFRRVEAVWRELLGPQEPVPQSPMSR